MKKSDFKMLVDEQINAAAHRIIDKGATSDDVAFGKLTMLFALSRTLNGKPTNEDIGRLGAMNDVLQILQIFDKNQTIFSGLEA
jgi:hypothetical protein